MFEYGSIILWKPDQYLEKVITDSFSKKIVYKYKIKPDTIQERKDILNKIYWKTPPNPNCVRIINNTFITVFIIQDDNPKYEIRKRTEGTIPVNLNFLNFKTQHRSRKDYTYFHVSDHVNECNDVIKVFKIPISQPFIMIEIEKLKGIIWFDASPKPPNLEKFKLTILPLLDTPHADFIRGNKDIYEKYVSNIDTVHNPTDYLKLIKTMTINSYNNLPNIIKVSNIENHYIIEDGLHRATILAVKFKFNMIKVELIPTSIVPHLKKNLINSQHYSSFNKFASKLNSENIDFVIVRGWTGLPITPVTDLDISFRKKDIPKVLKVANNLLQKLEEPKAFTVGSKQVMYYPYRTYGSYSNSIHNGYFRLDLYDTTSFPMGSNKYSITDEFEEFIFANKITNFHYHYIDPVTQILLTFYRAYYDLNKKYKQKYIERLKLCSKKANYSDFKHICALEKIDINKTEYIWKNLTKPEVFSVNFN